MSAMPLPIRKWAAAGVLAGALALAGCGSDDDVKAAATPTATEAAKTTPVAVAAFPEDLRGSWKRKMTRKDWGTPGYPVGTWRFDADDKGEVDVYSPLKDDVDFNTEFGVDGEQVSLEIPVCPGQAMKYAWRASGDNLTLTVVDDAGCTAGAALFGGTWTRRS
jgi:hypothetical protein